MNLTPLVAAMWLLAANQAEPTTRPEGPIKVGDRRQVFVDDSFLTKARGVRLVVHPPRKTGEFSIRTDRPWEHGGLGPFSSVLKDGETYHMWYQCMDTKLWDSAPTAGAICYATSRDGIHWDKPDVALTAYEGSRKNNIVVGHGAAGLEIGQGGMMVFLDPTAPQEERFRMVNRFNSKSGVNIFSSGDGIHWRSTHQAVISFRPEGKGHHLDSQNVIFWDEGLRKYVAYVRRNLLEPGSQGRTVARGESDRLGGFPVVQDLPVVLAPDELDRDGTVNLVDYYNSGAIKYPWADCAYYLFPQVYYHYTNRLNEFSKQVPTNAGPLETQFAASRDGVRWERFDRRPFVPLGMRGEFDCYSARLIYGLVPDLTGTEMFMYYRGSDWLHGWDRDERNRALLKEAGLGATQDVTAISRLVLRRDGFVSVRAEYAGGEFTTPALQFAGSHLVLNVDTSATGRVRVELQDGTGTPLPGYSIEESDTIHTANEIDHVVTWKGRSDLSRLGGRSLQIHFIMAGGDLYAFQFKS